MADKSRKTRATSRKGRDLNRSRRPRPPRLPPAAPLEVPKPDPAINQLGERIDYLEGLLTDQGRGLAQVKSASEYWSALTDRVDAIEKKPEPAASTTVVEVARLTTITRYLVVNDVALIVLAGVAWWYWRTFGLALPPFLQ
jgi:hypothetical protein